MAHLVWWCTHFLMVIFQFAMFNDQRVTVTTTQSSNPMKVGDSSTEQIDEYSYGIYIHICMYVDVDRFTGFVLCMYAPCIQYNWSISLSLYVDGILM